MTGQEIAGQQADGDGQEFDEGSGIDQEILEDGEIEEADEVSDDGGDELADREFAKIVLS